MIKISWQRQPNAFERSVNNTPNLMHLDLVVNCDNAKEIRPVSPQQLDYNSDIEITKVIPCTINGVTTTIKQKKETDECSNNVSNLQNNYQSEIYKLNERITSQRRMIVAMMISNLTLVRILLTLKIMLQSQQAEKCISMNVIENAIKMFQKKIMPFFNPSNNFFPTHPLSNLENHKVF